ncbi:hypothetical protein KC19_5G105800 [Ceratodon purpureus]|uniref:Uncharacterized protein n=1 Tax=Ceratodon purpureus TaxID=3225 RepID=A0A8T0I141_CERPU|nr:hypothetical protein KC19_5G105800 [Ceratodon purpureus]
MNNELGDTESSRRDIGSEWCKALISDWLMYVDLKVDGFCSRHSDVDKVIMVALVVLFVTLAFSIKFVFAYRTVQTALVFDLYTSCCSFCYTTYVTRKIAFWFDNSGFGNTKE